MKTVSEKINGRRSMGGLMKLRFLALVLVTIAIMPQIVVAQSTTPAPGIYFPPAEFSKSDPIKWDWTAALKAGLGAGSSSDGNSGNGVSMWQCIFEERNGWDRVNDTLDILSKGILGYKALENAHYRDTQSYSYLRYVAQLNNSYRTVEAGLYYSTQQQIAKYQYLYGGGSYAQGNSGGYGSYGVRAHVREMYGNAMENYWSNAGGGLV